MIIGRLHFAYPPIGEDLYASGSECCRCVVYPPEQLMATAAFANFVLPRHFYRGRTFVESIVIYAAERIPPALESFTFASMQRAYFG